MNPVAANPSPPTTPGFAWAAPYLFAIAIGGLAIRLALTPFGVFASDAAIFRSWATRLVTSPLTTFYAGGGATTSRFGRPGGGGTADHLPGDLWFLWLIGRIYRWFSPSMNVQSFGFLFLLKLVPSLADIGIGLLLYAIAARLAGARAGLIAAACWVFNPASIFLSATWGQWDSVSAFFMLLALWLVVRGNPIWALPALTYACLIKPQFAALAPLVLLAWWRWRVRPNGTPRPIGRELTAAAASIVISVGVFLAVDLPFSVGIGPLPTRWSIIGRANFALDRFTELSANAFNLWGVIAYRNLSLDDRQAALFGLSYQHWGALLLGLAVVATLALFWRRPTAEMVLWAGLALTLALFVLPTRMHERYLLPAVVLGVLVSTLAPRMWWIGATLSLSYLANIVVVYGMSAGVNFVGGPSPTIVLVISAVNLFLLLSVFAVGLTLAGRTPEGHGAVYPLELPASSALPVADFDGEAPTPADQPAEAPAAPAEAR